MKTETQEIAQEVIKQVANSPKTNAVIGSSVAALGGFWDSITGMGANDIALYLGIGVAALSLYNQLMVAIRGHIDRKKKINND